MLEFPALAFARWCWLPACAALSGVSAGCKGIGDTSNPLVPVVSVQVSPSTLLLGVGQTSLLVALPLDADSNVVPGRQVTWATAASEVATVAAGGAGSDTVRVSAVGAGTTEITASVDEVESPPISIMVTFDAPGPVDFVADWTAGIGANATALTDGGKWPLVRFWGTNDGGPNPGARVINDTDFPSGRAFASGYHGKTDSEGDAVTSNADLMVLDPYSKWPVPAIGQTLFHRFYLKNTVDAPRFGRNMNRGSHHPFQGAVLTDPDFGASCAFHWEYKFDARTDGTFTWEVANLRYAGSWTKSGLALNRVYLMEVAYTRTDTFRWTVRARLDGVELGTAFGEAEIGTTCLGTLFIGNNDPGSGPPGDTDPGRWRNSDFSPVPGGPYADVDTMRWGAVAVAVRDDPNAWIGAYVR
jgi:hypothetical protein